MLGQNRLTSTKLSNCRFCQVLCSCFCLEILAEHCELELWRRIKQKKQIGKCFEKKLKVGWHSKNQISKNELSSVKHIWRRTLEGITATSKEKRKVLAWIKRGGEKSDRSWRPKHKSSCIHAQVYHRSIFKSRYLLYVCWTQENIIHGPQHGKQKQRSHYQQSQ
mgnify:CR=1 FL=1